MLWFWGNSSIRREIEEHVRKRDEALACPLPSPPRQLMAESVKSTVTSQRLVVDDPSSPYKGLDIELFPEDLDILSSDIAGITSGIQSKKWTATQVLCAFIRATRRAQIRTNALTEVFFESALQRAAELDRKFEATGELVGPLHGVPISLKDMLKYKNTKTTSGFSSWLKNPADQTSATTVTILEHLGAIHFVKTNVPQTFMTFESLNPVFGRTSNPWNNDFTSGGSSGGESALLMSDGAAAGIGTDIAGSLRIPSHHTGVYTVKPSPSRWCSNGLCDYGRDFEAVDVVVGPMCRTAADCELLFTEFLRAQLPPWLRVRRDCNNPAILKEAAEYDQELAKFDMSDTLSLALNEAWLNPLGVAKARGTPLRIGFVVGDGIHRTTPAVYRAVKEAVAALRSSYSDKQIEIVEIRPDQLQILQVFQIFLRLLTSDGFTAVDRHLGSDSLLPQLQLPVWLSRIPAFIRSILVFIIRYIVRDKKYADIASSIGRINAKQFANTLERRTNLVEQWNKTIWEDLKLDAFIAPTQACPAVPHGGATYTSSMGASTVIYNVTKAAVAVLPVLRVDPAKDSHKPQDYVSASAENQSRFREWVHQPYLKDTSKICNYMLYSMAYDAHKMAGLPVGLQVVTRPYHEEKAIGIMRLLDDALPPLHERGGPWKNKQDPQGKSIPSSHMKTFQGFGPGKLTRALFDIPS